MNKYTIQELAKKFNWTDTIPSRITDRIKYAKNRGVEIVWNGDKYPATFTIVESTCFRIKELIEMFNFPEHVIQFEKNKVMRYFARRGIILEEDLNFSSNNKKFYKIIENLYSTLDWVRSDYYPEFECTKTGLVRSFETKALVGTQSQDGYIICSANNNRIPAHRIIKITFEPIENPELFVVDHKNGIRNDNELSNLQWVVQQQNCKNRDDNYIWLNPNFQKLIQKFGYKKLNIIFEMLLNDEIQINFK